MRPDPSLPRAADAGLLPSFVATSEDIGLALRLQLDLAQTLTDVGTDVHRETHCMTQRMIQTKIYQEQLGEAMKRSKYIFTSNEGGIGPCDRSGNSIQVHVLVR